MCYQSSQTQLTLNAPFNWPRLLTPESVGEMLLVEDAEQTIAGRSLDPDIVKQTERPFEKASFGWFFLDWKGDVPTLHGVFQEFVW